MTIAATAFRPAVAANTPKESPKRTGPGASGNAARTPSRNRGARGSDGTVRTYQRRSCTLRVVRIVVSGASGLIGSALVPALEDAGHEVLRLVRRDPTAGNEVPWDPAEGRIDRARLAGVEAAVNLNGATIGKRWTAERKREILASRVDSTRLLSETLAALDPRPGVLVCAGGAGIYGYDRGNEILTEESSLG